MIKSELIRNTVEKLGWSASELEELTTILEAWEGIGLPESEIITELKDYEIYI